MSDRWNKHEFFDASKLELVNRGRGIVGDLETLFLQCICEVVSEIQLVTGIRFVHVQFRFYVVICVRWKPEQRDVFGITFSDDVYLE